MQAKPTREEKQTSVSKYLQEIVFCSLTGQWLCSVTQPDFYSREDLILAAVFLTVHCGRSLPYRAPAIAEPLLYYRTSSDSSRLANPGSSGQVSVHPRGKCAQKHVPCLLVLLSFFLGLPILCANPITGSWNTSC